MSPPDLISFSPPSMGNGVQFMTKYAQLHQRHQEQNRLDEVAEEGGDAAVTSLSPAMATVINMNGGGGGDGDGEVVQKALNGVEIPMATRERTPSTSVSLKMHDDDDDDEN